jgi:hypothetical protein
MCHSVPFLRDPTCETGAKENLPYFPAGTKISQNCASEHQEILFAEMFVHNRGVQNLDNPASGCSRSCRVIGRVLYQDFTYPVSASIRHLSWPLGNLLPPGFAICPSMTDQPRFVLDWMQ